ncbi:EAL domain-containing protein [Scandinavium goeteborgense]|uniref:EAL domain-containing protein n=1 Tax=Scandinavium goeteborgense TaxID=1851514 RepID=UPI0037FAE4CD
MNESREKLISDIIIKRISNNQKPFPVDIWFQPLFDLSLFKCTGGEILIRGQYLRETILPFRFIASLERHGTGIVNLGHYLVNESFEYINRYFPETEDDRLYNINISKTELLRADYAELVITQAARYSISPPQIILEITGEDAILTKQMLANLKTLREHGFTIAWGDIYSLLMLELKNNSWQADYIKLDRRLMAKSRQKETQEIILEAHRNNIKVIAEGVETLQQVSFLLKENVSLGQGYLFSRPITKEMFLEKYSDDEVFEPDLDVNSETDE